MSIQDWFPLGWTGWLSLQSKGLSRVFSKTTFQKCLFFGTQLSLESSSQICAWLLDIALTRWTFVGKVMSLLFNMLSRLVITFLPRSKHLWILWLQSPSAVILEPPKIKSVTVSIVPHIFVYESDCLFESQQMEGLNMVADLTSLPVGFKEELPSISLWLWFHHCCKPSFWIPRVLRQGSLLSPITDILNCSPYVN